MGENLYRIIDLNEDTIYLKSYYEFDDEYLQEIVKRVDLNRDDPNLFAIDDLVVFKEVPGSNKVNLMIVNDAMIRLNERFLKMTEFDEDGTWIFYKLPKEKQELCLKLREEIDRAYSNPTFLDEEEEQRVIIYNKAVKEGLI